ncbi:MAG: hypothetical protein M5U12_37800 [Verrucomicrobia bacterium]|nr:hypothetical protein [Verrucomicrobiota bacterium]
MATLSITLPAQPVQTAFNLRRWEELLSDPELARIEGRIETDRHGHILMSPPPLRVTAAARPASPVSCWNCCRKGPC